MKARAAATVTGCLAATVSAGVLNRADAKPLPYVKCALYCLPSDPVEHAGNSPNDRRYLAAMSGVMKAGAESMMMPFTLLFSFGSVIAVLVPLLLPSF